MSTSTPYLDRSLPYNWFSEQMFRHSDWFQSLRDFFFFFFFFSFAIFATYVNLSIFVDALDFFYFFSFFVFVLFKENGKKDTEYSDAELICR